MPKLDDEERELLRSFEAGEWTSVSEKDEEIRRYRGDAREALTGGSRGTAPRGSDEGEIENVDGFRPLPHRGPPVTNEIIDRLREEEPE